MPEASVAAVPIDGLQATVVEEATRILQLHRPHDPAELVASPWLGLHFEDERLV